MKTATICFASAFATPFGPFSVAVDDEGRVTGTVFGGLRELAERVGCELEENDTKTRNAREQLLAYFERRRPDFNLPLAATGSAFQHRVWKRLQAIPRGTTASYGQIAKELASSARAVGRANATNPICVIVPCHRVIGADGSLTGFAFGEEIKRRLLELEGAMPPAR